MRAAVREVYAWFEALCEVGFTREEAIQISAAWQSRPPASLPPDLLQLIQRQTRFFEQETG